MLRVVRWLWRDQSQREYNVYADKGEIRTERRPPLRDVVNFHSDFHSQGICLVCCSEEDVWILQAAVEAILNVVERHERLCDSLWVDENEDDTIWPVCFIG